jgi:hypothetical protein
VRRLAFLFAVALAGCSSGNPASGDASTGGTSAGGGASGGAAGQGAGGAVQSGGAPGSAGLDGGGATGSGGQGGSGGVDAGPGCTLTDSGPLSATSDGQVIEKLRITSTSGAALTIHGHANVVVRDVEILHAGGPGIDASNAPGLLIQRVHVVHTGAPPKGPNPSADLVNISIYSSDNVTIEHARLERGSSGIYLVQSPGAKLGWIEGHDFRGPFPRGQVVQFDNSPNSSLADFSCEDPPDTSWPEDNVSVWRSSNVSVQRGFIDGNNSPTGVGVMFELSDGTSSGGLAEDVDTVDMGNGSFSGYPARDVTFRRTRARDNHCSGQAGRAAPSSGSLVWAGSPDSQNLAIEQSSYYALCNPQNLVWDKSVFTTVDISKADFTPRAPIREHFCWEP